MSATGLDGDYYIDAATGLYYFKAGGVWTPTGGSVVGPAGQDGGPGVNGRPGVTAAVFEQAGVATAAVGAKPYTFPANGDLVGVVVNSSVAPSPTAATFDVLVEGVTRFPTTAKPSLVGSRTSALFTPDVLPVTKGERLTVDVTSVGATGGTSVPTVDGAAVTSKTTTGTASSFNIPVPVNLTSGDLWVVWVTAGDPITAPSGWTVAGTVNDTALSLRGAILTKTATGTEPATQTVTFGAATPYTAISFAVASPGAIEGLDTTFADAGATTHTTDPLVTSGVDRLGIWLYGWRHTSGAQSNITISGGAAPTELADIVTERTGASTNFGAAVATKALPTAGTAAGATGTVTSNVRWVTAVLAVASGGVASTPGEDLGVTVFWRETA